jgi:anaerobic selenocysteine-containing dehydrogenase
MDSDSLNRPLRVAGFIATRAGDADRGPAVFMHPADARARLLTDGELAGVHGPRRHELATVHIEPGMRLGDVDVRDIAGVAPSEIVRVVKPDLDSRGRRPPTSYA